MDAPLMSLSFRTFFTDFFKASGRIALIIALFQVLYNCDGCIFELGSEYENTKEIVLRSEVEEL